MRRTKAISAALVLAALGVGVLLATRNGLFVRDTEDTAGSTSQTSPSVPTLDPNSRPASFGAGGLEERTRPGGANVADSPQTVRVVGRVVDDRRMPVAGATVTVPSEGPETARTTTGPDGRFVVEPRRTPTSVFADGEVILEYGAVGVVRVMDEAGRCAIGKFEGDPPEIDVGTLEIEPTMSVRVMVLEDGRLVSGARVLAWIPIGYPCGAMRVSDTATGASGETRVLGIPGRSFSGSDLTVLAIGGDGRRGLATTRLPRSMNDPLLLTLGVERTIAIRVVDDDERPVKGATVMRWPDFGAGENARMIFPEGFPPIDATNSDGATRVRGCFDGEYFTVTANAPGFEEGGARNYWIGSDASKRMDADDAMAAQPIVVYLTRPRPPVRRTLTFPIAVGELPVPASGTALEVRPWPGQVGSSIRGQGRVDGDRLVVEDAQVNYSSGSGTDAAAVAIAPDGTLAELHLESGDVGKPTSCVRARRIAVNVTDETGRGVADFSVLASDAERIGGIDWRRYLGSRAATVRSDSHGHGELSGLPARRFLVREVESGPTDEADLSKGDATVDLHVGAERELEIHLRIDGEPRLPSDLSVGLEPRSLSTAGPDVEDPVRGVVRLRRRPIDPTKPVTVSVGGTRVSGTKTDVEWPPPGTSVVVSIDLQYAARLVVDVAAPREAAYSLRLEKSFGPDAWGQSGIDDWSGAGPDSHAFDGLDEGSYRVRDQFTGATSLPVDVRSRLEPYRASLDLSRTIDIAGQVEIPDGYSLSDVHVLRDGIEAADVPSSDVEVDRSTGAFHLRLPGGTPITLRATHPELRAESSGRPGAPFVVTESRDDVVLRLVEGPRAFVNVVSPIGTPAGGADAANGRVSLYGHYARAFEGEASFDSALTPTAAGLRFAGFRPGTFDIFLDVAPFAPKTLAQVALGEGKTDLGEVHLERGSVLTIHGVAANGKDRLPLSGGGVESTTGPSYRRIAEVGDDGVLVVRGLAAGHFVGSFDWHDAKGAYRRSLTEFDVDGHSDLTIDVDLK